jgi:hypothetical protein
VRNGDLCSVREGRPDEAARYFVGIAQFRMRARSGAIARLHDVVAEQPRRADARLYLGLARLMDSDVAGAREDLVALRGLRIHPRIAAPLEVE